MNRTDATIPGWFSDTCATNTFGMIVSRAQH